MPYDVLIRGGRVVLPSRGVVTADVAISGERIAAILAPGSATGADVTVDATGLHVLPGAIDSHVHWGYRGDFAVQARSDSRAAALGGVTTAHLLHRIPPGHFEEFRRLGESCSIVDFIFTPTVIDEATAAIVDEMIVDWGCPSVKFYLGYRGMPDAAPGTEWNQLTDGLMVEVLERMARYDGTLACVHAENAEILARTVARGIAGGRQGLGAWEEANPGLAEAEGIQRAALFAEHAGLPLYVVHLGGRDALRALARAKAHWPRIYGETCPHYLYHNVDSSPVVKFSPPVRRQADNEALWDAVRSGLVDCIGSDNAPTLASAKEGSIWETLRGGPGAGLTLPFVLSEGVHRRGLALERAVALTSTNAARLFGLYPRKGTIQVGSDADLALVDLNLEKTVSRELFDTWSDYSMYGGLRLRGWPVITMLRGRVVARDGVAQVDPGYGRFLPRTAGLKPATNHPLHL
ncbi:MAG: amidohydrolase family protein [Chloroflexi bacterium]|nr:amidohydrolase family protein [Chloroflexota bacterium]